ncbi:MAG: lipopolysaccharide assembly protein LapA domain-containing protein [Acidimicrobiia bacterium]|nr:lipopolysaccharide assembly protein LapA domain-containing protein [Acidimicrobiia bacterium]
MNERRDDQQVKYRGTGFYAGLAVTVILTVALLVLAIQNTESVAFEFLGWDIDAPLFALILIAMIGAVLLDELIGLVWRRSRRRRLGEREELERLRAERAAAQAEGSSTDTPDTTEVADDAETAETQTTNS